MFVLDVTDSATFRPLTILSPGVKERTLALVLRTSLSFANTRPSSVISSFFAPVTETMSTTAPSAPWLIFVSVVERTAPLRVMVPLFTMLVISIAERTSMEASVSMVSPPLTVMLDLLTSSASSFTRMYPLDFTVTLGVLVPSPITTVPSDSMDPETVTLLAFFTVSLAPCSTMILPSTIMEATLELMINSDPDSMVRTTFSFTLKEPRMVTTALFLMFRESTMVTFSSCP